MKEYEIDVQIEMNEQQMDSCAEACQEMAASEEFEDVSETMEAPEGADEITEGAETPDESGKESEEREEQLELGYSSDYYKHKMASAIKNGNKIAYENAKDAYSKALVRESVGAAETQEPAEAEAGQEKQALGYSSDYYKSEMANAIKNGNEIAYENAKKNYANALVKEQTK